MEEAASSRTLAPIYHTTQKPLTFIVTTMITSNPTFMDFTLVGLRKSFNKNASKKKKHY
jgi:hypothetical protein